MAVDDQEANLIALQAALKDSSYRLVTATSGAEALEHVRTYEFAAILLDIQMPNLDGFETAQLIRRIERGRHTPIIFLTAIFNDEKFVERGYEVGAVDYIYKPVNVSVLKAKLEVFAELFRKTKEIEFYSKAARLRERLDRDRRIAEIQEQNQKQYQDLVEGIRNGIVWTANAESLRYSFVSPHAETILGYPLRRWLDDSAFIWSRVHEEDRELVDSALRTARETGEDVEFQKRMIRSDGECLWFNTTVRCAETDRGKELRGLCIDVTRLKETETSLREMLKMRDEFLSIASHELKTPLTPLQLQVQAVERLFNQGRIDKVPRETLSQLFQTSTAQVSILVRLVDQLLDVSRITSGKLSLVKDRVDLAEIVSNVVRLFMDELLSKSVEVRLDIPGPLFGTWDCSRLEQVVMNLLNNAIKYGEGKPIQITVEQVGDQAVLEVADDGIGIAPADQKRIFERFERAVPPQSFSGLGLGLYITRQLVELHGGRITVQSDPRSGTRFTVVLPIDAEA